MTEPSAEQLERVLVAATLVSASLAVLFVVWQEGVARALALEASPAGLKNENDGESRGKVRAALFLRAGPLLLTSLATFLVLLHQSQPIIAEALRCVGPGCELDDVKALYVINAVVVGLLTIGLAGQCWDLCRKWRKLGGLFKHRIK